MIYSTDDGGVLITTIHKNGLRSTQHYPFEIVRNERELYSNSSPLYLIGAGFFLLMAYISIDEGVKAVKFPWFNLVSTLGIAFLLTVLYFILKKKVYLLKTFQGSFIRFPVMKNPGEISLFVAYHRKEK